MCCVEMDFRPGDWLCACSAHNYASKSSCFKCRLPREASDSHQQPGFQQQQPQQHHQQQPTFQSQQPYQQQLHQQQPQYQAPNYNSYNGGGGLNTGLGGYGGNGAVGLGGYGNGATGYAPQEPEPDYTHQQYQQQQQQQQQPPPQMRFGDYRDPLESFRATIAANTSQHLQQALAGFDASSLFPPLAPINPLPANFRAGDWLCTCGNHNYAIRTACGKCTKPKMGAVIGGGPNLPGNFRPGDWMCKCGNHNYQSRTVCGKCQGTKDNAKQPVAPQMAPNFQVGDWMCVCGAHNYQSKAICYKCNLAKESAQAELPPVSATAGFRPGDWLCSSCKNHNYASRIVCGRCKNPKPAGEEPPRERSPTTAARERSRSRERT